MEMRILPALFLMLAAVAGFAAAQADNAHPVAFPRESGPRLFRARAEQRRVAACLSMVVMSALPPLAHVFLALWHDFPVVVGMFSSCIKHIFQCCGVDFPTVQDYNFRGLQCYFRFVS